MSSDDVKAEGYYQILVKFAKQKGLIFHPDQKVVMPLVEGLVTNKNRFGYPSCPCRFAWGEMDRDRDIICPCVYAKPDIEEYGKCYCSLYVSEDFLAKKIADVRVPERRPAEKMGF